MKIKFYKYHGTGNDFIMIDDRENIFPVNNTAFVARLCNRYFGIGADGLILLQKNNEADFFMKYYNSDGNESSMCGNGGRCIAAFANRLGIIKNKTNFIAIDGIHEAIVEEKNSAIFIELKMQDVKNVEQRNQNNFVLDTGSPHYVKFVTEPIEKLNLIEEARKIRYSEEFKAKGINVNFVNRISDNEISIRTYERGVENETLSCGTGVVACAISNAIINNSKSGEHLVKINTQGGKLEVKYNHDNSSKIFSEVILCGPAEFVFEGEAELT